MSRVDYCVTTMMRPQALRRLLLSVAGRQPDASIHVVDQSEQLDWSSYDDLVRELATVGLREPPMIHHIPFDMGVSVARNFLMHSARHDYVLLLDDDFVFTERTDIGALALLLDAHPDAGAVGGSLIRNGQVRNVGTRLEKRGASLYQLAPADPIEEFEGVRFRRVDCVPVFVLMRREILTHVRWDPSLKTASEHFDFFMRMRKTPYHVLHAPDVSVDHPPIEVEPSYRRLRLRGEFLKLMMARHRLLRVTALDGTVLELCPDGSLVRHRGQRRD